MFKEILVIDDNPDIRFLICNILEEQRFKVRSAANYDQAVLEINNRLPDLAIIDIKLDKPDKDGIDLLKLINKKNVTNLGFRFIFKAFAFYKSRSRKQIVCPSLNIWLKCLLYSKSLSKVNCITYTYISQGKTV